MTEKTKPIGLAEMIDGLRQELVKAQKKAKGSSIIFEVENIDLELKINVERGVTTGGGASVKFWVMNADTKAQLADKTSTVQTIKLSLSAKDKKVKDKTGKPRKVQTRG